MVIIKVAAEVIYKLIVPVELFIVKGLRFRIPLYLISYRCLIEVKYSFLFWYKKQIYKLWMETTSDGFIVWFELYQGAWSEVVPKYKKFSLGPSVILQYANVIAQEQHLQYHIFHDIFTNIWDNRTSKCPLIISTAMEKTGEYGKLFEFLKGNKRKLSKRSKPSSFENADSRLK